MKKKNDIPDQFRFDHHGKANPESIVIGTHYRFTILTERFIRMEYSEDGVFEDRPSQMFFHRLQVKPAYLVSIKDQILQIKTDYLELKYDLDKQFDRTSLSIRTNRKTWRYGSFEKKNKMGTSRTLDGANGSLKLEKGLFSVDGYVVLEDNSIVFEEGWIAKRRTGNLDFYFFAYGNDYETGLRDFYKVSGKTPMIPRYALGNWWSRYWGYNEQELVELINGFEKRNIPLSVCVIDMDWHKVDIPKQYGSGWTGYSWNKALFSDPQRMIQWLKDKKLSVSLNLHPALGIRGHEDVYLDVAKYMGVDYLNEEPVPFDSTDPKFMNAYFELVHHPLEEMGIDFWWIDWQQGSTSKIKGLDPLWMLNHLHYLDLARDGKKRGFIFSRYAGIGSHRYPIGFSGDTVVTWESLAFQPFFTANATNVGFGWWSHDIGGHFYGTEDPELYTRWVQFGVFSPIFRLHTSRNFYYKREPWKWGLEVEKIVSDYMRLRHRMIPYIYSIAYQNSNYGLPLIRPMGYYSEATESYRNQYYFGDSLVIAPPITKRDEQLNRTITKAYLPRGDWFDFFTGEYYSGGREYAIYSKLDQVPVFAKAGSIIPLAILSERNQTGNPRDIELILFPGADGRFDLYEDDGVSQKYLCGESVLTTIRSTYIDESIHLTIGVPVGDSSLIPEDRTYYIKIMGSTVEEPIMLKGNEEHHVSIHAPVSKGYAFEYAIMDVLLDAVVETKEKAAIGFIGNALNKEKGGILGMEIPLSDKIELVKKLEITQSVKDMAISFMSKHL